MIKNFKKFGIMSAMLLAVLGVGALQNCITANAATIGQQLTSPEAGWKRYDDTDKNITYGSTFRAASGLSPNFIYNGTYHYIISQYSGNHYMKFSFYGSELRFIARLADYNVSNAKISFDGGKTFETLSEYMNDGRTYTMDILVYQKTGLEKKVHDVVIEIPNSAVYKGVDFVVDAIDIDSDGELMTYGQSESISLNKSSLDLSVGNSEQLTAITTPAAVGLTWKSSDESVATVDSTGKVTAIKAGQATVTATAADASNLSASCTVNVKDVSPTVVSLSVTPLDVSKAAGETLQLQVIATMSDGSTKNVTSGCGTVYSSMSTSVATVDENGLVTVLPDAPIGRTGSSRIRATYGGKSIETVITVCEKQSPTVASLSVTPEA